MVLNARCTRILLRDSGHEEEEQPTHLRLFYSQKEEVGDTFASHRVVSAGSM